MPTACQFGKLSLGLAQHNAALFDRDLRPTRQAAAHWLGKTLFLFELLLVFARQPFPLASQLLSRVG